MGFQKPPGTQDILPGNSERWQFVEKTARDIARRFRFREVRTPIFEATELFKRGVGETTDIVEKEMYTFEDRGKRSMTLRPEGTAGVVRAYVENKLFGDPELAKLYYIGPMFRYERAQAGRYRQFHQFGVEAIGSAEPALDAEVIAMGFTFYRELGLTGVSVEINSVGTPAVRAEFREMLLGFLRPIKDQLCSDCQARMERNPLRVLDCKVDQDKFTDAPSILDSLDEECSTHFARVRECLDAMNIPYQINHRLVRGLDYYTHTAFEYKAQGIGAIDTIGGGGRYNGLVADIGGDDQPGVGFGIGLERTLLLLEDQKVALDLDNGVDVYFVALGERADRAVPALLQQLRDAGLAAERDYQGRKTKAQFKSADRVGARFVAVIGDDELDRGEIALKRLSTGEQQAVSLDKLVEVIRSSISAEEKEKGNIHS
jgi:histidyl-tRNA synthetase